LLLLLCRLYVINQVPPQRHRQTAVVAVLLPAWHHRRRLLLLLLPVLLLLCRWEGPRRPELQLAVLSTELPAERGRCCCRRSLLLLGCRRRCRCAGRRCCRG
jgi:hypothetical protein